MADVVSKAKRSKMMSGIRGKDTKPEMVVRRQLHAMGYRYRLHRKDLPGRPDIVLPKHKTAVFVNGCFWHGHDCHLFKWPSSRADFWKKKISGNQERDRRDWSKLEGIGWQVVLLWECEIRRSIKEQRLEDMLREKLK